MRYIKVGIILSTHGLRGEVSIKELTAFSNERFKIGAKLYLDKAHSYKELIVKSVRRHKDRLLICFEGYEDINLVECYKGCMLYIKEEDVKPLADDEIYYWQLKECKVYDENGYVGDVVELIETGANVILRIKSDKELLVPFVKVFFPEVDVEQRILYLKRMEGLS